MIVDDADLITNSQNLWCNFKTLATVLSVPVIAIPKAHTLGCRILLEYSICQEADSATYLSRYKDTELHIIHSKSGEGVVYLKYDKKLATFTDLEKEPKIEPEEPEDDIPF